MKHKEATQVFESKNCLKILEVTSLEQTNYNSSSNITYIFSSAVQSLLSFKVQQQQFGQQLDQDRVGRWMLSSFHWNIRTMISERNHKFNVIHFYITQTSLFIHIPEILEKNGHWKRSQSLKHTLLDQLRWYSLSAIVAKCGGQ